MVYYSITSQVWLSLEPYYNAGITPEQAKECIEKTTDDRGYNLTIEKGYINNNWGVNVNSSNKQIIESIVYSIEERLYQLLTKEARNKVSTPKKPIWMQYLGD